MSNRLLAGDEKKSKSEVEGVAPIAVRQAIKADLYRYTGSTSFTSFLRAILLIPGFRFSYFFRKGSRHRRKSMMGRFFQIVCRHYSFKFGIQIPVGTSIGPGLYLGHWGQTIVNPKAIIGKNCNIAQGVTIGQTNRGERKGTPTIGDNVWIGANSVLAGRIRVGTNVLIAPNSFVNFDVPDNSIVVTQKCKIISDKDATKGYISRTLSESEKPRDE